MWQLLSKYGVGSGNQPDLKAQQVSLDTIRNNSSPVFNVGDGANRGFQTKRNKRRPNYLRGLAKSALPSRAISLIRDGVTSLKWAVQPREILPESEKSAQFGDSIETVLNVLRRPNWEDDDFITFVGQIVEDLLVFDAGCWEYVERPRYSSGSNDLLALFPVPGDTIAKNVKWSGNPTSIRWRQTVGEKRGFTDLDLEYLMHRKQSGSAFGYSPLESAVDAMESWLGLSAYQGGIASNAYPSFMFYMGDAVTTEQVKAMRGLLAHRSAGPRFPWYLGKHRQARGH